MSFTYSRRVRYYETDRMGVVHHSNYLRLLEDARMEWMDSCVMPYRQMERMGLIVPAAEAQERFLNYLRFDDPFSVTLRLAEYTGVKMTFTYEVRNDETGDVCLTARSTHFFSVSSPIPGTEEREYRPVSIKRRFPELHALLLAQVEE